MNQKTSQKEKSERLGALATLFISTKPTRLTKQYSLDSTGHGLVVTPGGEMVEGRAVQQEFDSLSTFGRVLTALVPSCALSYGVAKTQNDGVITVMTEDAWQKAGIFERIEIMPNSTRFRRKDLDDFVAKGGKS